LDFYQIDLVTLFERSVPTPIPKNTTKGTHLYGLFVKCVMEGKMTAIRNMPKNINKIESASLTPFLDTINNPTVSGNKSIIINPSNRNCEEKAVNPAKNL